MEKISSHHSKGINIWTDNIIRHLSQNKDVKRHQEYTRQVLRMMCKEDVCQHMSLLQLTCFWKAYGSRGAFSHNCKELADVFSQSSWYLQHKTACYPYRLHLTSMPCNQLKTCIKHIVYMIYSHKNEVLHQNKPQNSKHFFFVEYQKLFFH